MKILPTLRLIANDALIAAKTFTPFNSEKIQSPGIRLTLTADLNNFLDTVSNSALLLPSDGVEPRLLHINELRQLADSIEKGEKDVDLSIYNLPSEQLIVLKVKRTN